MINIATAINHYRETVMALLSEQDDFHIIGTGKDGYDAIKLAMIHQPNIMILDFNMEDITGPDLAPILKRKAPSTALIVLYSPDEENAATQALKAGISGCLLRDDILTHLAPSIRSVFYGGLYISDPARDWVLHYSGNDIQTNIHSSPVCFTSTEQQIFYGIICGYTDKEIAKNLNMSNGSLRNCVSHVKKKTGLQNRTQITTYALLTGIINIDKILDVFNVDNKR